VVGISRSSLLIGDEILQKLKFCKRDATKLTSSRVAMQPISFSSNKNKTPTKNKQTLFSSIVSVTEAS
jgi:hypothetical protein